MLKLSRTTRLNQHLPPLLQLNKQHQQKLQLLQLLHPLLLHLLSQLRLQAIESLYHLLPSAWPKRKVFPWIKFKVLVPTIESLPQMLKNTKLHKLFSSNKLLQPRSLLLKKWLIFLLLLT